MDRNYNLDRFIFVDTKKVRVQDSVLVRMTLQITQNNFFLFLTDMQDFDRMNAAYVEKLGDRRPARTTIAVSGLPKPGALLTMNLTAVTKD